ncbi:Uncharacterised protein [Mycobacteroides abscessus subsp. abscessus]|uniref:hypothetical protein n=1 Tax=Mycobacteroides abscessus TaxID=36809 RepID=UPI0009273C11|nr:hypothetical protein [Mycobacteroides abscessus]SID31664.1 Uncharacterised protein [Mycobacteroides abscessus subsp. abscessus]SID68761.1 Uncharacterised protein [Mycobacteroides abscessus subsp. abscessus]SKG38583.1 Uncharacterised protein [Mycobacteroides abscessus subsp. abscessus]SKQ80551.1 Uncharacterised protein [Mycobacteroides abscessus subsp. abscessus]
MALTWNAGELHDAAEKVLQLEAEVRRDPEYQAFNQLERIADSVGVSSHDAMTSSLDQLLHTYRETPVPADVIQFFGDVLWKAARAAEQTQLEINRQCARLWRGFPYTG